MTLEESSKLLELIQEINNKLDGSISNLMFVGDRLIITTKGNKFSFTLDKEFDEAYKGYGVTCGSCPGSCYPTYEYGSGPPKIPTSYYTFDK